MTTDASSLLEPVVTFHRQTDRLMTWGLKIIEERGDDIRSAQAHDVLDRHAELFAAFCGGGLLLSSAGIRDYVRLADELLNQVSDIVGSLPDSCAPPHIKQTEMVSGGSGVRRPDPRAGLVESGESMSLDVGSRRRRSGRPCR